MIYLIRSLTDLILIFIYYLENVLMDLIATPLKQKTKIKDSEKTN